MIACPYCDRRHPARELHPHGRGPLAIADCPPPDVDDDQEHAA